MPTSSTTAASPQSGIWGCSVYRTATNPSLTYRSKVFLEMATAISVDFIFPLDARTEYDGYGFKHDFKAEYMFINK